MRKIEYTRTGFVEKDGTLSFHYSSNPLRLLFTLAILIGILLIFENQLFRTAMLVVSVVFVALRFKEILFSRTFVFSQNEVNLEETLLHRMVRIKRFKKVKKVEFVGATNQSIFNIKIIHNGKRNIFRINGYVLTHEEIDSINEKLSALYVIKKNQDPDMTVD